MSRYNKRLVFLDGFAGPGQYAGGEPGSPMIALDVIRNHSRDMSGTEIVILCIEENPERARHLELLLESAPKPANVRTRVRYGRFDDAVTSMLDFMERESLQLSPTLALIDPFGFTDTPFRTVRRLAQYPKTEVLISFMVEAINRFRGKPELEPGYDALFGTDRWRQVSDMSTPDQRWRLLHDVYRDQLVSAGLRFPRSFEMRDEGGRVEYFLMFGTHSLEGLKQMKAAMWTADPTGGFRFSDATNPAQMTFLSADHSQLRALLHERFRGTRVGVDEIEMYVLTETAFRETHFKPILKQLERERLVVPEPLAGKSRRVGTFPAGTSVTFV